MWDQVAAAPESREEGSFGAAARAIRAQPGPQLPHSGRPASPRSLRRCFRPPPGPLAAVGRVLKGRHPPQNCLRWCPLQLKWNGGSKRPALGRLRGDRCVATQVWDLSRVQRWGKVGKVGRRRRHSLAGLCAFHHLWARAPLRGGRLRLLRPQPHPGSELLCTLL